LWGKQVQIKSKRFGGNELKYLAKVLEGEHLTATSGSWTHELEQQFAKKMGSKYAIAFNSGTSTLHAALVAVGVKRGDKVIVPALGPIMTSAAVIHASAIPVFADVQESTFNIDPADVARKMAPDVKAIIGVHLYGLPCDMDALKSFGVPVIEDCAQALLATYKGKYAGTIGAFGSFSFENSKHISCGEGGMLITDDENLALLARRIGGHGFIGLTAESGRVKGDKEIFQSPSYKRHAKIGWNYRMSELQAAVALAQLERVDELVKARMKSGELLAQAAFAHEDIDMQEIEDNSYWSFAMQYFGDCKDFRERFIKAGGHPFYGAWSCPFDEPAFAGIIDSRIGDRPHPANCPVAERIQPQIMQFKTSWLDIDDARKQAVILKGVLE
jgi:perosamine synthetase